MPSNFAFDGIFDIYRLTAHSSPELPCYVASSYSSYIVYYMLAMNEQLEFDNLELVC